MWASSHRRRRTFYRKIAKKTAQEWEKWAQSHFDPPVKKIGRNTIQLEDAVSTISQEYLQEFASEYYIPKSLHPELPGPKDNIIDFPEGKIGVYTKNFEVDERVFPTVVDWRTSAPKDERPAADSYSAVDVATLNIHQMDLFNLINAPNPLKVKTRARPRLSHESPLDFSNEESLQLLIEGDETETQVPAVVAPEVLRAKNPATMEVVPELNLENEAAAMRPPLNKRRRKRDKGEAEANAPPKILMKDHASVRPQPSTAAMLQSVSEPDPISYAQPQPLPHPSSKKVDAAEDPDSKKSISFTSMGGPPEDIYQPGWGMTNNGLLDNPEACQDMVDHIVLPGYFSVLRHLPNDDFLGQYNASEVEIKNLEALLEAEADMKKATEAKNAELLKELDSLCIQLSDLQELYPHMLTAIAGPRWVIGHGLRLAVMKCAESMELRHVFANVVSAGIAKGMSEG
ncbi:hypothetical protein Tco_1161756, partial [Tanacetum coccineum]